MNALQILQFFGISLIPFVSAVVLHLFFKLIKHYPVSKPIHQNQENWFFRYLIYPLKYFLYLISSTERGHYWFKQICSGAVLGGISIVGFFLGIKIKVLNDNILIPSNHIFVIGNSTIPPVVASLMFGWPAGILSSIIGLSFRITRFDFLQMPTATAIAFSGIFSGLASHFLFRDKHPKWYLSSLCSILVETFNLLLVFAFNISNIIEAYELLIMFDVPCIIFAALSTTLSSLVIAIIDYEYLLPHKKEINNTTTRIQSTLFIICAAGLTLTGITIQGVSSENATYAGVSFRVAFYIDVIIFILIFMSLIYFIDVKIIKRVESIDDGLEKIMDGDLNYTLQVKGYNEFKKLSNNINLAVGALRNYANEVQHQIDTELKLARDIQLGSVLKAFPSEDNYNIYAKMELAKEVGGDFYDYVKMNNGRVMIVIADVSGKGVPAALFMMRAKTLIKSFASTDLPLSDIVSIVNNDLCTQNEAGFFVTAWIGILDTKNGELRYVSAGHPNPIVKHNGKFTEFKNKHYPALAVFPNVNYDIEIGYFEPGDELVLYTDGVTEAQNNSCELYGMSRLIETANNAKYFTAKQLLDEITDDVSKFVNGDEQFDDITLLIIRYLGDSKNIRPETTITLKARPINASIAVNFVESILTKFNLTSAFVAKISIVVDELFANVAFYAYPKDYIGELSIEVDMRENYLCLNFIDSGKPFDPTKPRKTNLSSNINDRERGGLGIYIVKKTMDDIKYEYKDHRNTLRLTKKILPEDKNDGKENE